MGLFLVQALGVWVGSQILFASGVTPLTQLGLESSLEQGLPLGACCLQQEPWLLSQAVRATI